MRMKLYYALEWNIKSSDERRLLNASCTITCICAGAVQLRDDQDLLPRAVPWLSFAICSALNKRSIH